MLLNVLPSPGNALVSMTRRPLRTASTPPLPTAFAITGRLTPAKLIGCQAFLFFRRQQSSRLQRAAINLDDSGGLWGFRRVIEDLRAGSPIRRRRLGFVTRIGVTVGSTETGLSVASNSVMFGTSSGSAVGSEPGPLGDDSAIVTWCIVMPVSIDRDTDLVTSELQTIAVLKLRLASKAERLARTVEKHAIAARVAKPECAVPGIGSHSDGLRRNTLDPAAPRSCPVRAQRHHRSRRTRANAACRSDGKDP